MMIAIYSSVDCRQPLRTACDLDCPTLTSRACKTENRRGEGGLAPLLDQPPGTACQLQSLLARVSCAPENWPGSSMAPWNSQKKDTGSRQGAGTAGASSGSGKAAVLLSNPTFEGRKNDQGAGVCRPAGLGLVWVPSKGSGGQRRQRLAASAPLPSSSGCLRGVAWRTSGPVLVLGHFCTGATEYGPCRAATPLPPCSCRHGRAAAWLTPGHVHRVLT